MWRFQQSAIYFKGYVEISTIKDIVEIHDGHLDTGIIGTRYLFDVLTKSGYVELAYQIVTQETYPGWGYMIREGATTLWERWENLTNTGMNSHNHIMFGSVDAWFYRGLAGIGPLVPGWRKILIAPHMVGDLKFIGASVRTPRGIVKISIEKHEKAFKLALEVPVNSQAELVIPRTPSVRAIAESGRILWADGFYRGPSEGVMGYGESESSLTFTLGSGAYWFEIAAGE